MFSQDSIRRGHLIYGAGVGGLTVLKNGTSVICAGLDYWFKDRDGRVSDTVNSNELDEWRLKARLRVRSLRQPPAPTETIGNESKGPANSVVVPFLRFPQWHVCPRCRSLEFVQEPERRCRRVLALQGQEQTQELPDPGSNRDGL